MDSEAGAQASKATKRLLLATEDGSLSLRDETSGELYHNRAGAYSEALLNYIKPSAALTRLRRTQELKIIDACFGLGYNSFVLAEEALKQKLCGRIQICGIDSDPRLLELLPEIVASESFVEFKKHFDVSHLCAQKHAKFFSDGLEFELNLLVESLRNPQVLSQKHVDYVFHDPFSPRRMPELWTVDIFRQYNAILTRNSGAMLTYSSAAAIRGGLSAAGFVVKRTAAVGGKSGGTIGMISPEAEEFICANLSDEEMLRLTSSSGVPYSDPSFSLSRQQILENRQIEQKRRKQGLAAEPAG